MWIWGINARKRSNNLRPESIKPQRCQSSKQASKMAKQSGHSQDCALQSFYSGDESHKDATRRTPDFELLGAVTLKIVIIIIIGPYKATRLCMHIKPELQVNLIFLKIIKTLISGLIR
jgi:hypothetical protein